MSFSYPSDWVIVSRDELATIPQADSLGIQDPTRKITIHWISYVDGLGGWCDPTIPPHPETGDCPYYEVVDIQKLPNASLYYVAYVATLDGESYSPAFALQDDSGILESQQIKPYLLFEGVNNGKILAGLLSGDSFDGLGLMEGTREEALLFFNSPEAMQAKISSSALHTKTRFYT